MDYMLKEQLALVALNGQDSVRDTLAKKAAIAGIEAANVLQLLLLENEPGDVDEFKARFKETLEGIKKISRRNRRIIEKEIVSVLKEKKLLEEIPSLLGCDMNYYTAKVTMREYKGDEGVYQKITESIKAVILEPGEVSDEVVAILWLFRECGCMHDIFSVEEQRKVQERLIELAAANPIYKIILEGEFSKGMGKTFLGFLGWKHNLFKNPYLEGINLLFPFLDRKQAIFIDMVIFGTTVKDRRQAAIEFLRKNGHSCEELRIGSETLVKIDNSYYRIWPSTRSGYKIPIQGVELLPAYR